MLMLDVPFYPQENPMNCGPVALRMIVSYFDRDYGTKYFEEKCERKEKKGIFTIQIGIASILSGYKTDFYSKSIYFDKENLELDFYKRYADLIADSEELVKRAKGLGVRVFEEEISLEKILGFITEDSVPIVLVDWNVVRGTESAGYQGHFVVVVGYDEESVYVHDQGTLDPKPNVRIQREVFDKARKAKGTDEDVVVVYRGRV